MGANSTSFLLLFDFLIHIEGSARRCPVFYLHQLMVPKLHGLRPSPRWKTSSSPTKVFRVSISATQRLTISSIHLHLDLLRIRVRILGFFKRRSGERELRKRRKSEKEREEPEKSWKLWFWYHMLQ
ncbi:hypothetical protein AAC387_Pa01g1719 [Persea americana]